ncbi:hypothetical protein TrVFT333_010891 [Trichoderma virens FT-333]|nr:hypothetical protein TrVFT333_010891 [Trichoderma virens FT-333]
MPLTVAPASEADLPRSIAIEKRAYGPNKSSPIFFPGEGLSVQDRISVMTTRIREESAAQCIKVVDTELEGEASMIAFSMWFIWSGDLRPSFPQRKWGLAPTWRRVMLFSGKWTGDGGRSLRESRMFLLHTDPDHQRRGAGGKCLQWGTSEADRLGLVSYLEASEEGRPLYEKYGFKEVDRIVVDLTKWGGTEDAVAYLMIREPVLN